MIPTSVDYDLENLRKRANLTQTKLATILNLKQSQVQRYETDPGNVPFRIIREWVAACGQLSATIGFDFGSAREPIQRRLESLRAYSLQQPVLFPNDTIVPAIGIEKLIDALETLSRKKRLVLAGQSDGGKSRFGNTAIGGDRLPSEYRPMTKLICLIRHSQDKPKWQKEDVWIMDEYFDLSDADNQTSCEEHKIRAGDFETLKLYGTHPTDLDIENSTNPASPSRDDILDRKSAFALIYIDAPILLSCDIVDTPGFFHDLSDDNAQKSLLGAGDAVLYLSPTAGFMKPVDLQNVANWIEALPVQPNQDRLRSLAILATHAHPGIEERELKGTIHAAAERLAAFLKNSHENTGRQVIPPISPSEIERRIFPWYVETPARRSGIEQDLKELFGNIFPATTNKNIDDSVNIFRENSNQSLLNELSQIESLLFRHKEAQTAFDALIEEEPKHQERLKEKIDNVQMLITNGRRSTNEYIKTKIAPRFEELEIQKFILERFTDKSDPLVNDQSTVRSKNTDFVVNSDGIADSANANLHDISKKPSKPASERASEFASSLLMREVLADLERFISEQTATLSNDIDDLLREYQIVPGPGIDISLLPFDSRAAFLGGVAGVGVFGGLAGWAAIVAGGSNLGAYLLVPEIVSLLSSLGIGISGGTATGVSIVAALGGPVSVGLGIAATIGLIAWQLFGRSWQTRLAQAIAKKFKEVKLINKIEDGTNDFWDNTISAFNAGIEQTVQRRNAHVQALTEVLRVTDDELRERQKRIEARRSYLKFMPWTNLSGDIK
jgi:transcriptional regulator with XRE-family HTH domain